jgi:tetratricopeptide (TPR) repeat protein
MGLLDRLATTLGGGEDVADDARAEIERALAFGAADNWHAAEAMLSAAAERHRVPAIFVALGDARARLGRDEGAVQAFGQAVDLSAHAVDGWLGLGEALVRLGRFEPAREALRKVLARTGESGRRARAHAARGRIALGLDEPARAVRELREAATLLPHDYAIAHDLGRALSLQRDPEASSWLARAAHAPTPDPRWVLDAAAAAPSPQAAHALLQSGLDVVGEDRPEARAAIEAALAQILARNGAAGAEALAQAAIQHAPNSPVGQEALSVVHEVAGALGPALAAAEQAVAAGGALDLPRLLRLALAAQDRSACLRVVARGSEADPLVQAVRAFASGTPTDDQLVLLGLLAGSDEARRFVAAAASPGPVPEGNLYALLSYARALATSQPALAPLVPLAARAVEAFDRPLLVAVMGEFNAGKSSFVNALVGEKVAEVGVTPTTATINVLRYGPAGGRILYHDGRAEELAPAALAGFFAALDDARAAAIRMVEVFVPLELLRRVEVVDTPGLNSLRPEHEAIARGFLTDADAIVWLFAVNQAAKATERDALALARAAGKRVLGVLNKADQASAEEIAEIKAHVSGALGPLIETLRPLSAQKALRWQKLPPDKKSGAEDGGLAQVLGALDERFFAKSRELKRTTALGSLNRFVAEARALLPTAATSALPPDGADLDAREETLKGAVATAKLATRARLEAGFRQAASELAELFEHRPSRLLGERGGSPEEDRRFLLELLEDVVFEATAVAARELEAAAAGGPALPIERLVDRFRAFARGVFRGGLTDQLLRRDQPGLIARPDASKLARTLVAAIPDAETELYQPLSAAITAAYAQARDHLDRQTHAIELRALIRDERVGKPLANLAAAITAAGA